jgi:Zn-dependent M16 (insulinase) family peptidase
MRARENTEDELCAFRLLELLHAPGSGYSSNTGGKLENLRALTNASIKQYHSDYYRPDNLCLIVTGQVEPAALLAALEPLEAKLLERRAAAQNSTDSSLQQQQQQQQPMQRPWWRDTTATTAATVTAGSGSSEGDPTVKATVEGRWHCSEVTFPSEEEDTGSVSLGWLLPPDADALHHAALRIAWLYLCDSPVSPLRKAFVERQEGALCGSVHFELHEGRPGSHSVTFCDADAARLHEVSFEAVVLYTSTSMLLCVDRPCCWFAVVVTASEATAVCFTHLLSIIYQRWKSVTVQYGLLLALAVEHVRTFELFVAASTLLCCN